MKIYLFHYKYLTFFKFLFCQLIKKVHFYIIFNLVNSTNSFSASFLRHSHKFLQSPTKCWPNFCLLCHLLQWDDHDGPRQPQFAWFFVLSMFSAASFDNCCYLLVLHLLATQMHSEAVSLSDIANSRNKTRKSNSILVYASMLSAMVSSMFPVQLAELLFAADYNTSFVLESC